MGSKNMNPQLIGNYFLQTFLQHNPSYSSKTLKTMQNMLKMIRPLKQMNKPIIEVPILEAS